MIDYSYFVFLRLRGKIEETGEWMNKNIENRIPGEINYVDILITKQESQRIVEFLSNCIGKK